MFDILALVWALIRGRALVRAWALIRGNTVSNLMFEERAKPSCKKTAMRKIWTMFLSLLIISPRFASARANYSRRLLLTDLYLFFFSINFL